NECGSVHSLRIAEQPRCGLKTERLVRLSLDPGFSQAFDDRIRIIPLELELGAQEHRVIQVTPSVGEAELVALANLNGALFIAALGRAHEPADLIRALAGISADGAADRAGNPDQGLQSGKTVPRRLGDERR